MHELTIAESMLQVIEDAGAAQGFTRVRVIWLELGCLAGIDIDALRFCFDAVARDGIAQDARLEVVSQPGSGHCAKCGMDCAVTTLLHACPHCGEYALRVTGGDQMRVKELDVV